MVIEALRLGEFFEWFRQSQSIIAVEGAVVPV